MRAVIAVLRQVLISAFVAVAAVSAPVIAQVVDVSNGSDVRVVFVIVLS